MNAAEARERALRAAEVNRNVEYSKVICAIDKLIEQSVNKGLMQTWFDWNYSEKVFCGRNIIEDFCEKIQKVYEDLGYTVAIEIDDDRNEVGIGIYW